ncbi:NifB/NifX family molybdenum-iron cluster-binding protein [candidate division KSB1 bacterium]
MKSKRSSKKCINPWFGFLAIFIIASSTVFAMFEIKAKHIGFEYINMSEDDKNYNESVLITSTGNGLKFPVAVQFETCKYYLVVNPSTGKYSSVSNDLKINNNGQIRNLIQDNNVGAVITGTMNYDTYQVLESSNVDIYTGLKGTGDEVFKMYKENKLVKFTDKRGRIKKAEVPNKSKDINLIKRIVF